MPRRKSSAPRQQKKSSLVENINRRKRRGISRRKSRSSVSQKAYRDMQRGWPGAKKNAKKRSSRRSG